MSIDEFRVADQVVAITGGTGVLGGALAVGLASAGAKVAVMGRREEQGRAVVERIRQADGVAEFFAMDVTSLDSCRSAADAVIGAWDHIDALINAAGGNSASATATPDQSFFDLDAEALQFVMQLNAMGTVLPCQVFGQQIARRQRGAIINISSMSGFVGQDYVHMGYNAAKGAVRLATKAAAIQFAPDNIRVNSVHPGVMPPMRSSQTTSDPEVRKKMIAAVPLGREGRVQEVAFANLFLASDESSYITGIELPVDGGYIAQ